MLATAALLVGVLHLTGRRVPDHRPFALAAALLAIAPVPLWAVLTGDSPAIYAAVGLLLLAATPPTEPGDVAAAPRPRTGHPAEWAWTMGAALPLVLALLLGIGPTLVRVLLEPYAWIGLIWSGPPAATPRVPAAAAVAMLVLTLAAGLAGYLMGDRRIAIWSAAPILAVAAPVSLAAAGAPWPVVPAAELLLGLVGLLAAALRAAPTPVPVVVALLAAAGVAGALPTRASTLAALGAVLIAAAVAGTAGRTPIARVCGWLAAVAAALALAGTAGSALELSLPTIAFLVLGAAAAALALAWTLLGRRPFEARAVETAAHAGAAVALLLTVGSARPAAAVCTLWGLALGLRALRPAARRGYLVAASVAELAAWFLLMAAAGVGMLEAYTVPAAAVALLAGLLARQYRPSLSSWTAYGPALAAALLPSLASIVMADGQYLRRLLLGLSALAIVIVGANARLRAPVVLGGGVLILVALHEVAQVWDLIPRWIPLAAGGLVLVLIATTVERRRRDLDRFRAALTRMT